MYKLFIFDLDDTLIHEGFEDEEPILCDDTIKIFELLKSLDINITIATFNENGVNIIKNAGIDKYIIQTEAFCDFHDKSTHVSNILLNYSQLDMNEVCYVDDDNNNCIKSVFGIKTILADYSKGITLEQIKDILS